MSYLNHEHEIEKLVQEINNLRDKFAKMGIFTYITVNNVDKPTALLLSVKIDDIGRFVIERIAGEIKEKIGVSSKVVTQGVVTYLSIIMDLRNAKQDEVKQAINNAVKLIQEYSDTGIGAMIIPSSESNINKIAFLVNMNDYGNYIIKSSLKNVKTKIPVSMSIKSLNVEKFGGSYIVIRFGNNDNRVIG